MYSVIMFIASFKRDAATHSDALVQEVDVRSV